MKALLQNNKSSQILGIIGKHTYMTDSYGEILYVGDVVTLHHIGYPARAIAFVQDEDHKYNNWTGKERSYVHGIANVWCNENFINAQIDIDFIDDLFYEKLETFSDGWTVKKVKNYDETVVGERIGFAVVGEIAE